ncbi:hypothetical protein ACFL20_10170 [Spirochaetota bacterium]
MSHEKYIKEIQFEIEEINELIERYKALFDIKGTPDLFELTSMASLLHSLYTGIEKIFINIAKNFDKNLPSGNKWHKDLLNQMSQSKDNRANIISHDIKEQLSQYLVFRHFFRHGYSFHLEYDEIKDLIESINPVWKEVKDQIIKNLNLKIN